MNLYFIVSSEEDTPPKALLSTLNTVGKVIIIRHSGPLSEINELKKDPEEKILALDPGVFEWKLDAETIKEIPKVKAVCTSSTSFDWINPKFLKE